MRDDGYCYIHNEYEIRKEQCEICEYQKEILALKQRESKLIEGLKKAVKSAQFYSRHADCRKDSWACSCEFCKNTSSSKDLRESRAVLKELGVEM